MSVSRRKIAPVTATFCVLLCLLATACPTSVAQKTYTNSIGVELVLIPAGAFLMGADARAANEKPPHRVRISRPFYLSKYEVTQEQWQAVMGNNPSEFKGKNNPVEQVSWEDAQEFIRRLNEKEGHGRYRLPTEAEWEYAARAGTTSVWSFGDDADQLGQYAWYLDNSAETTHPVGQKKPNAWGLYDMHGNVFEWVQDWYGENYYASSPSADPSGPSFGYSRVQRGGCWGCYPAGIRSTRRSSNPPGGRSSHVGFRLALFPE